jgi:hypothetical protein
VEDFDLVVTLFPVYVHHNYTNWEYMMVVGAGMMVWGPVKPVVYFLLVVVVE